MKITKEKVIYFLSLNLLSILIVFSLLFVFFEVLETDPRVTISKHILDSFILSSSSLFIILPLNIINYIFSSIKRWLLRYFLSMFVPITFLIAFSIIMFGSIEDFLMEGMLNFILYAMPIFCIVTLIILGITEPLRRKIVW